MKATKIGHWPGQDVPCCEKHAAKLKQVGQAMEVLVSFTECTTGELCTNCLNEQPTTGDSQSKGESQ